MGAYLAWLGACAPQAAGVGEVAPGDAAIVDGVLATADPAVVAVAARRVRCGDPTTAWCTGTLLHPRVVMTAAHCVSDERGPVQVEVFAGSDAAASGERSVVVSVEVHPGHDPASGAWDVAMLLLDPPLSAPPVALPTGDVASLPPGAPLRVVGFGVTGASEADPGVKREGRLLLGAIDATSFEALPGPAMSCQGDSGGPVFAEIEGIEQLVGVTVDGDVGCEALAVQLRVDAVAADFVAPFLAGAGDLPLPLDGPVALDAVCTTGCVADADCPAGFRCAQGFDGQGRCTSFGLPAGDFDAACGSDGACASGVCARLRPEGADACRCFDPCEAVPAPRDDTGRKSGSPPGCGCVQQGGGPSGALAVIALLFVRGGRRAR